MSNLLSFYSQKNKIYAKNIKIFVNMLQKMKKCDKILRLNKLN